jgi:hypothetical protein
MSIPRRFLALIVCPAAAWMGSGAASAQTLRYSILFNTNIAGSEVDTYHPDGSIDSTFEFNDRGRGRRWQRTT